MKYDWATMLVFQLRPYKIPEPEREHEFAKIAMKRRWRFDLAWEARKLAVEIDGGLYVQGRHSRASGQEEDMRKFAAAIALGWNVVRVSVNMVKTGEAAEIIAAIYKDDPAWLAEALRRQ